MLAVEALLTLNGEFQALCLLPSSSWSCPIPLLSIFLSLSGPQKLSTIFYTILPATLIRRLWVDKLFPVYLESIESLRYNSFCLRKIALRDPTQNYHVRMFEAHFLRRGSHHPQLSTLNHERGLASTVKDIAKHVYDSIRLFGPAYRLFHKGTTAFQLLSSKFLSNNVVQEDRLLDCLIATSQHAGSPSWLSGLYKHHVSSIRSELLLLPFNILLARCNAHFFARDMNLASFSSRTYELYPVISRSVHVPTLGHTVFMLARTYLYQAAISIALFGTVNGVAMLVRRWQARRRIYESCGPRSDVRVEFD